MGLFPFRIPISPCNAKVRKTAARTVAERINQNNVTNFQERVSEAQGTEKREVYTLHPEEKREVAEMYSFRRK